jgi:hypothetical protein
VTKKKRLTIQRVNHLGLPFLKRENIDNIVSLRRKEGIPVRVG